MERWVPGAHAGNVFELYALPLFSGLHSAPAAAGAGNRTRAAATPP
jgi:hypothetical protein